MKLLMVVLFMTGRSLSALPLLLMLISCARQHPPTEPFPTLLVPDAEWVAYEGILRNGNGQDVHVELELIPASPGIDSWYKIRESLSDPADPKSVIIGAHSRGTYSVLQGSHGQNIVKINDRSLVSAVNRGKLYGAHDHVGEDLMLASNGNDELLLLDEDLRPAGPRYKLLRRSDLFTVEGYFTVYGDTAEYFERNTRKGWAVARFAEYDDAVMTYHSLATEPHEGLYLKALAYSTKRKNAEGREIDALVFKRILDMDSTRSIQ